MSALGQKGDLSSRSSNVRFIPQSRRWPSALGCPLSAISGTQGAQQKDRYSITSSARASTVGGIARPSAFAALRLMTNRYLEACSTGRSAGLAPLRILSIYVAARLV